MVLESFLGDTLLKNDGGEVPTSDLSTEEGGVIGLYFTVRWRPTCRHFTAKLTDAYTKIKGADQDFEVIFVSWDSDEEAFQEYHKEQPWLAIPFTNTESRNLLREKYQISNIPALILLSAATGHTIRYDGCKVNEEYGGRGYPFTREKLNEQWKEIRLHKEQVLTENLKFVGTLSSIAEPDKEVNLLEVSRNSEAIALTLVKGHGCYGSTLVLSKLVEVQRKMGKGKLNVIIVPIMDDEEQDFSAKIRGKIELLPAISRGAKALEFVERCKDVFKDIQAPHVFIIDARNCDSVKLLAENAGRAIYFHGEGAFPWSPVAVREFKDQQEAMKRKMKAKKRNLEFFTPSDHCHVVDKQGVEVPLYTLQSTHVVGLYFGGDQSRWRGVDGRSFTPKLIEMYEECKEQCRSFEVIFLSSDRTQESFDACYSSMPWPALHFDDRTLRDALSDLFRVVRLPSLILLRGDGELIADDTVAYEAVSMGADYFPWSPIDIERGHFEREERQARKLKQAKENEQKCYIQQMEAGKVPLRRHIGEPLDVRVGVDHMLRFGRFSTVTAPSAVIENGTKAWYEVTFLHGFGVSQVGWATSEFEGSDNYSSDGVGDDTHSWGFDGQRVYKWYDGETSWGRKIELSNDDHVLGVAVDMEDGRILYGLDGDWGEPMGVAFDDLDVNVRVYPAITCSEMQISVNFGDREMSFGPPDDSFQKVSDVVKLS